MVHGAVILVDVGSALQLLKRDAADERHAGDDVLASAFNSLNASDDLDAVAGAKHHTFVDILAGANEA